MVDQQQLKKKKVNSGSRLTQLLTASPAVIYSFKASGDFAPTFVSANIEALFGYAPREYLENANFWSERVHPEDLKRVESEIARQLKNGKHVLEYRFRRKDGSYCWVSDEQRVVRDEKGEPVEVIGSWSDITARKQVEEAAAAARERLSTLLETVPAVIYSFKARDDFAPTFISENIKRVFGYHSDEYLENADFWRHRVHPADLNAVEAEQGKLFKTGRHATEYRFRKSDGSYCWVSDEQSLIKDADGHPVEVVGSWSDVTARKIAEQEAQEAGQLILQSLRYASRIQSAILPAREELAAVTADHFLIWEPRDIVGGDFFWFQPTDDGYFIIVGDCTGHGVPGAFMTLIAWGMLDRSLAGAQGNKPSLVLAGLHRGVQSLLGQDRQSGETDDGLEAGVCFINPSKREMTYAGARFSLWKSGADVTEIKGDRQGLGYRRFPREAAFTDLRIPLDGGDAFYLTTDGLIDQIGVGGSLIRQTALQRAARAQPRSSDAGAVCIPAPEVQRVSGQGKTARRYHGIRLRAAWRRYRCSRTNCSISARSYRRKGSSSRIAGISPKPC
jgi:PAS domain S-box-containing protein